MKRTGKFLSFILVIVSVFVMSACGPDSGKDDWDGVQIMDNTLAETMQVESGIINPPTIVCELNTKNTYEKVKNNLLKPSSVIVRLNSKFNVVDANKEVICSFSELYNHTLKKKIIPIIYITDEGGVQRTIELFTERYNLLDAAVMSDNPAYVKAVRKECVQIRGIVEFKNITDVYDAVCITNANLASVAVIPQSVATAKNVTYIQSRLKTVWVRSDSSSKADLCQAINSGTYGIVSDDYESVIRTLAEYEEGTLTRTPFIVAHRGLPNTHNENSISGVRAAIEAGATHLELDGYLTKDNRIALMHDSALERTSNGEGEIESYTFDELKNFQLDLFEPYESIPSLDDVLEEIKGTDVVLLFEIKSQKSEIVGALKTALEKHDMWRQVVVISFNSHILDAMMNEIPEIPTANLISISENNIEDALFTFGMVNAGCDSSYGSVTQKMNEVLRDRGIIGWYWTYDTVSDMTEAMLHGYVGLTTNIADEFVNSGAVEYISVKGDDSVKSLPTVGMEISLVGITYKNLEKRITGKVFYAEDIGDRYAVIGSYTCGTHVLYTQTFYINKVA